MFFCFFEIIVIAIGPFLNCTNYLSTALVFFCSKIKSIFVRYGRNIFISIDEHRSGQICIVKEKPEATAINNIELSSFFCSPIDYLDWQATNICMGALGGNASGDQQ